LVLTVCSGCSNRNELIESELRKREDELRQARGELCQTQLMNDALQRELAHIQQGPAGPVPPEQIHESSAVKDIALGRGTGGYNDDICVPGDQALQVVLQPRDCDGHTIKAPGTLRVTALQYGTDGVKTPLSTWDVLPDHLRPTWKAGLWSSGYYVILPWKTPPTLEKMRVVAQFVLLDGRVFEADKEVTVRLPPAGKTKPPDESLPPPRPVDGPALSQSLYKPTIADAVRLGLPVKE
jgi:hypothetical protein